MRAFVGAVCWTRFARSFCAFHVPLSIGVDIIIIRRSDYLAYPFTGDDIVRRLVGMVSPFMALFALFDGLQCSTGGSLRGLGKQAIASGATLVAYYGASLPPSSSPSFLRRCPTAGANLCLPSPSPLPPRSSSLLISTHLPSCVLFAPLGCYGYVNTAWCDTNTAIGIPLMAITTFAISPPSLAYLWLSLVVAVVTLALLYCLSLPCTLPSSSYVVDWRTCMAFFFLRCSGCPHHHQLAKGPWVPNVAPMVLLPSPPSPSLGRRPTRP